MKITRIETIVVGAPTPGTGRLANKNYQFVKVFTDEGITGLGEASLGGYINTINGLLKDFEDLLIGEDPTKIEYLVQVMTRQKFWRGGTVKGSAVAAIECALWDILGKSLNVPVYKLFGGPYRNKIRVYANGWTGGAIEKEEVSDKVQETLALGYGALKFSVAVPCWPINQYDVIKRIVDLAESIREKAGPDVPIMFDGHGRYDIRFAINLARALEHVDLYFFEEPVPPEDEKAMAQVAVNAPMAIATGERLATKWDFRRILELNAASILQPDLARCHGFGEALKIAHLAEAHSAFIAPHCPMSPVLTVISMHLDAIIPNFLIQERLLLNDFRENFITEPLKVENGFIALPEKPGWGIELDEELCRAHPPIPTKTPKMFREDGSISDW